ncbi:ABC transporter [Lecanosticta acicola]|uniref:ABC transporter n=1 Tax=Lecanosticta acicola TaxID=111012 RepID=A0AAI8YZ35_9PEZI|nr:ABC transporter [Lecanosticta acicola]
MPSAPTATATATATAKHGHPKVALDDIDLEKHSSTGNLFLNHDVTSLAWRDLTVTVSDRHTREARNILHRSSGIVRPGQVLALMGPSGSGKSTLLNTLAQRAKANAGAVLVNGKEIPLAAHRVLSAFVEQEDTLIGALTVEETLDFAARLALAGRITRHESRTRVAQLIDAFGLTAQANTLIGTPIQKGISGGQKRRVSVATQLITGPRILYLDEPTSGLDSTASFEVMSFIRSVARRNNLIVIASIHQPSTKTLELFSKVLLLSKGETCYFGSVADVSQYFRGIEMPIPDLTNPAEHMLDLTNADFNSADGPSRLQHIYEEWQSSERATDLQEQLNALDGPELQLRGEMCSPMKPVKHSNLISQVITLLHRSFIKSNRDYLAYWVRLAMYMGLSIMMGTVWLRLSDAQKNIQPFINAIFFGSAFMSFMAVAYVPAFLEDRATFVKERANGLYGPTAFMISNFIIGLPYLFIFAVLFSVFSYWMINLRSDGSTFMKWVMWLFLDLLAAESLVVFMSSIFPNFVIALALIAFANGLWMSVGGFLVAMPILNPFYKYVFHYIDYQAYVFQGMMVNEFKARDYRCASTGSGSCYCSFPSSTTDPCKIEGTSVLSTYGYPLGREGKWVGIMIGIIAVYRLFGWGVNWYRKT